MKKLLITAILFVFAIFLTNAKTRVIVLPFENMDGNMEFNIWSYDLQDSTYKALKAADPDEEFYRMIPIDSLEEVLAELNLDPTNPQYKSDMWKACRMLKADQIVMGNFNYQAGNFLLNGYVYDAKIRLAHPKHQVRDIFLTEEELFKSVNQVVEAVLPALKK